MIGVVKGLTRDELFTVTATLSDNVEITGAFGDKLVVSVLTAMECVGVKGVGIHFSGEPKDGLSAGLAIWAAIYSMARGFDFGDVAMTGVIDSEGNVLKVGGIAGKLSKADCPVYVPVGNENDVANCGGTATFIENVKDLEGEI